MDEKPKTMVCPECGVWRTLDKGIEFCLDCGAGRLLHVCPHCGDEFHQITGRYHNKCGKRLIGHRPATET